MPELPKSGDGGSPGTKCNLRLKEHTMRHPESSNSRPEMPPQAARGRSRASSKATYRSLFGTPALKSQEPIRQYAGGRRAALEFIAEHGHSVHAFRGFIDVLTEQANISALREVSR